MPISGIGEGFSGAFANYMQQERQRARDREDQQLNYHMELIKALVNRPDINQRPEIMGQALHDMLELADAKGGKGKQKSGVQGFMGAHDLPISQFLSGIMQGSRPIVGPTQEADTSGPAMGGVGGQGQAPIPSMAPMSSLETELADPGRPVGAPTGGASILSAPIAAPPPMSQGPTEAHGLVSAGRAIAQDTTVPPPGSPSSMRMRDLPPGRQPYFIDPRERAAEQGDVQGIEAGGKLRGTMEAEYQALIKIGVPVDKAQLAVAEKYGLKQPAAKQGAPKEFEIPGPNGKPVRVLASPILDSNGKQTWIDQYGRPLPPDQATVVDKLSTAGLTSYQQHIVKDAQGNISIVYGAKDPTAQPTTTPPGIPAPPAKPTMIVAPTGVRGGIPAAPQPYVYQAQDPNNPGAVIPMAVDRRDLMSGGKGAPAPVAKPLTAEEKNFVDTAQGVKPVLERIEKLITSNGLEHANSVKDWASQRAQNWIRQSGFEPAKFNADLQQQTGYIRATLLRSLLGGRPSRQITEIFQSHLPKEDFTPAMIMNTIRLVKQEISDRYAGIEAGSGQKLKPLNMSGTTQTDTTTEQQFLDFITKGKGKK